MHKNGIYKFVMISSNHMTSFSAEDLSVNSQHIFSINPVAH